MSFNNDANDNTSERETITNTAVLSGAGDSSSGSFARTMSVQNNSRAKFSSGKGNLFAAKKARIDTFPTSEAEGVDQNALRSPVHEHNDPLLYSGTAESATSSKAKTKEKQSYKADKIETAPAPLHEGSDLLDHRDVADTDELYDDNERALSKFIKLHPMLSSEYHCIEPSTYTHRHTHTPLNPA
jgi:hypothetical protein